jgi:hypothetical protein
MNASSYFNVTLQAVSALGPSTGPAIAAWVKQNGNLSPEELTTLHKGSDNQTELEYVLGWSRTQLKNMGYLIQPQRGTWELTEKARAANLQVPENETPAKSKPAAPPVTADGEFTFGSVNVPFYLDLYEQINAVKRLSAADLAEILRSQGLETPEKGIPAKLIETTVFSFVQNQWILKTQGVISVSFAESHEARVEKYKAAFKSVSSNDSGLTRIADVKIRRAINRLLQATKDSNVGLFVGLSFGLGEETTFDITWDVNIKPLDYLSAEIDKLAVQKQ